jgi:hypothetical protein
MATNKSFSYAAFVEYGNKNEKMQSAYKADLKKAIAHAGYPQKDEIGIIDTINDFDMSNIMRAIPETVSGFMHDEQRAFELPAPDKKTAPATIKVVAVDKKTKTGTIAFGEHKGQEYKSTVAAHEEVKVKNNVRDFKK